MKDGNWLFNLLLYRSSPTGLSRYVERLLSAWSEATGIQLPRQLRVDAGGGVELTNGNGLPREQRSLSMRWLQGNALVQHAVPVRRLVTQAAPDLIYSPYTDRLLSVRDCPQVITCHDLTPLHWPSSRRAYWRSRFWLSRHLKGATAVVAISRYVADLLVADGFPAERITVIPNGIEPVTDPVFAPAGDDLLLLARHARNKNIALALKGFARFIALETAWMGRLVVVGNSGRETPALQRLERQLGLQDRVHWRSYLTEGELERQWRSSWALLSTSLMEGFDYPLLEAQAHGLPTLASRIPVHLELHSDVALFVDIEDDGVNLAFNLQRLARDPGLWQQLSQAGRRNAQHLSLNRQCRCIQQLLSSL